MISWAQSPIGAIFPIRKIIYDPRLLDQEIAAEHRPAESSACATRLISGRWEHYWVHGLCWCRHWRGIHWVRTETCIVVGCGCEGFRRIEVPVVTVLRVDWLPTVGEIVWISDGILAWSRFIGGFLCEYRPL